MTTSHRAPARGLVVSLASALLMLVLLVVAPAAHGHDTLVESVPAEGSVLEESPGGIVLTYSAEVLELSPVVVVTGADGSVVAEGTPSVDGSTVTLELPVPLGNGDYEVAWRVVSSDGHPIEGVVAFAVAADVPRTEPTTSEATGAPVGEAGASADESHAATHDEPGASSPGGADGSGLGALPTWLKVALMLAATASVVGLIIITLRRDRGGR
ncbi:copper resistance CopC family protein [Georgenia wangjunii]|uniref:copper resistance CopC family protein n=1 Tax=Georgenia wangjunii TaxID=3117730 RepID=UPI002F26C3AD